MTVPLRVALLLDSLLVPEWQARIIDRIEYHPDYELSLLVLNQEPPRRRRSFLKRLTQNHFLYYRYLLFERRRVRSHLRLAGTKDLESLSRRVKLLFVVPERKGFVHRFPKQVIDELRESKLDLMLRFGFNILRGDVLQVAKYGIWSFHHGDSDEYRGGPAGFWEVFEGNPKSGVTLQVLTEQLDAGHIISKTEVRTDMHSPVRNQNHLFIAGVRLMEDALLKLASERPSPQEFLARLPKSAEGYSRGLYRTPNNLLMLIFFVRCLLVPYLRSRIRKRTLFEQWSICFFSRPKKLEELTSFQPLYWIEPPKGRFYADPFLIEANRKKYVFFEDYVNAKKKGQISFAEVSDKGQMSQVEEALEESFHLAFPYLFRFQDQIFMLPEQQDAGQLAFYSARSFPYEWERKHTIFHDFCGVDPVLFKRNGLWWLFITKSEFDLGQNNLYLYFAESPFSPFSMHPMSPIKNELRGSRMAGSLFESEGRIIRPAQNCLYGYGRSVILYEVKALTTEDYQEEEIVEIFPDSSSPFPEKFHTLSLSGALAAADGSRYI